MTFIHGKKPVIFCDFDGTITMSDNIIALMKHFDPSGWEGIVTDIVEGRKSLRRGIGEMFALFPSERMQDIQNYVLQTAGIRDGFAALLAYCRQSDIPFLVTSGGIDFFVYPLLAPFDIEPEQIYCNTGNFEGTNIEIRWPHPCDEHCGNECGMCKTRVIRQYSGERYFRILIGDSLTDFEGSKIADFVFARSHLLQRCVEMNVLHKSYETFFEVIDYLQELTSVIKNHTSKAGL